jgi:hypothetical protein
VPVPQWFFVPDPGFRAEVAVSSTSVRAAGLSMKPAKHSFAGSEIVMCLTHLGTGREHRLTTVYHQSLQAERVFI